MGEELGSRYGTDRNWCGLGRKERGRKRRGKEGELKGEEGRREGGQAALHCVVSFQSRH